MSETMTYAAAFQRAMGDEMERDETIFVLGTDLYVRGGHFAQVKGLGERFGQARVRDTPISEAAMVAAGVGAAMHGMRPVVDLNFADFAMGAMDEIVNQAAKMRYMFGAKVPLVIRGSSGVGLFAAQHTNSVESWFAATPGLVVATPATPADAGGLLVQALRGDDPVVFLMHKRLSSVRGEVDVPIEPIPFGKAAVAREGTDVTLITYSFTVRQALEAAEAVRPTASRVEVDRPAHGGPARPRHDQRVGAQDRPRRAPERRADRRRRARRGRGGHPGDGARLPRRADRAARRAPLPDSALAAALRGARAIARERLGGPARHRRRGGLMLEFVTAADIFGGPSLENDQAAGRAACATRRSTRPRTSRARPPAPTGSSSPRTPSAPITSPRSGRACA